jgi:hypothetical protein
MYNYRNLFKRSESQIVVLLGAGAASAWGGILSEELKEKIIENDTYKAPDGKTIGKYLMDILDGFYGADNTNFETFLAALEEIVNYVFNSTNGGGVNELNTSFIPAIFNL